PRRTASRSSRIRPAWPSREDRQRAFPKPRQVLPRSRGEDSSSSSFEPPNWVSRERRVGIARMEAPIETTRCSGLLFLTTTNAIPAALLEHLGEDPHALDQPRSGICFRLIPEGHFLKEPTHRPLVELRQPGNDHRAHAGFAKLIIADLMTCDAD